MRDLDFKVDHYDEHDKAWGIKDSQGNLRAVCLDQEIANQVAQLPELLRLLRQASGWLSSYIEAGLEEKWVTWHAHTKSVLAELAEENKNN